MAVAKSNQPGVVYGLADFIAAEELDRSRGHWWSPSGGQLLVERFDESAVSEWFITNPTNPAVEARPHRYPAAGTTNASVELWLFPVSDRVDSVGSGSGMRVQWDRDAWEYVSAVHWSSRGAPLVQVLDRRQRTAAVLAIDPSTGGTTELHRQTDADWVDVKGGVPSWGPGGELLTIEATDDTYALCLGGKPVTPAGLQVGGVVAVGDDEILLQASEESREQHLYVWSSGEVRRLTDRPGVHAGQRGGRTTVVVSANLTSANTVTNVLADETEYTVQSVAATPTLRPNVTLLPGSDDSVRVAVVLPNRELAPGETLPVLMDPYGGPHAQRVISAEGAYRESQWFADQGFAVVVADGRGTPGSPAWERGIADDIAKTVLADQVVGLQAAASAFPALDLGRVGIRGWSFGGYLAALAVLERPDVFHAAVAGAPVTEWRLYDTAYTERYLGDPGRTPMPTTRFAAQPRGHTATSVASRSRVRRRQRRRGSHTELSQALLKHGRTPLCVCH